MKDFYVVFLLVFLGALAGAALLTPAVRWLAVRWGAMDEPNHRKIHSSPIPRLGGLAIWLALWASALLVVRVTRPGKVISPTSALPDLSAIFAAATVILLLGVADDRRGRMGPWTKLTGQFVACTILVAFGIRFNLFHILWLDLPLTYLWVLGLTNALNLLDNMDGLSAGVASIAAGFFFLLAVFNGQILVALLAIALVGSCLGFLLYNYNPASIFMGDSGALSLGFILAVISMKLDVGNSSNLSFVIAALVLALPIFDTSFVTWRRLREGRRVSQGAMDHTSHRLLTLGLEQRQAVWILYAASFVAGLIALLISQGNMTTVLAVLIPFALSILLAGVYLARVPT
ncbi:MAG TPA: MraY family glycosyltransferase [Chloroflexota bacterium]|nr:MraY family glycosyltransferase [Chloroflexota bacterium]